MSSTAGRRVTPRLRLEPISPALADDLWSLYQDPGIAAWLDGPWSRTQVDRFVDRMTGCRHRHGIGKWVAYDRATGSLIGRGGMSYRREIRLPGLVEGVDGVVDDAPFALYVLARTPDHPISRRRHRR